MVSAVPVDEAAQLVEQGKYEEAFPLVLDLAKNGSPKAQGLLARMYVNGWGVLVDEKEAFYWAQRGAQENDPASLWVVGYVYWKGEADFRKNLPEAMRWMGKAAEAGYVNAMVGLVDVCIDLNRVACVLSWGEKALQAGEKNVAHDVASWLEGAAHVPDNVSLSKKWAHKGAVAGDTASMELYGDLLWHSSTQYDLQIEKEALRWYKEAASRGSARGHHSVGWVHLNGSKELLSSDKAIAHLTQAAALGYEKSVYVLARAYLTGEFVIPKNSELGYVFLKRLRTLSSEHLSLDLESLLYLEGIDRPVNFRKAALFGLKAIKAEWEKFPSMRHLAFRTGSHLLDGYGAVFEEVGLSEVHRLAWARFLYGANARLWYDELKATATPEVRAASEALPFLDLLEYTITFLEKRTLEFGPIESADLINEGWQQFLGERGQVNEPLAQVLTEEGLRIAIRTSDQNAEAVARNNLGVFLSDAANKYVKNPRLSTIHIADGSQSEWGPNNLLWAAYHGEYKLSGDEITKLRMRYQSENNTPHRTTSLPPLTTSELASFALRIARLEKIFTPGDSQLASEIADEYEGNARGIEDYERAVYWYSVAGVDELPRKERVEKIIRGEYVKDMPNLTGTVQQLFEVDLVTTRGGLLTELKTAFLETMTEVKDAKTPKPLKLYALVVGNAAYRKDPLKNSVNDAVEVAKKLRALGFEVTEAIDRDRRGFRDVLIKFAESTKDADVTLFFYSGHGMQLGGINYLLPVDLDFSMPRSVVTFDGVSLNDVKNRSLNGATKIIFLDACRNNPFEQVTRGSKGRGLAPMNVGTGTLISFATKDGSVAFDGVGGKHSPYTDALLRHIDQEEDIELMLRAVGDEVMKMTNNMQEPWKYGALSGDKVVLPLLAR